MPSAQHGCRQTRDGLRRKNNRPRRTARAKEAENSRDNQRWTGAGHRRHRGGGKGARKWPWVGWRIAGGCGRCCSEGSGQGSCSAVLHMDLCLGRDLKLEASRFTHQCRTAEYRNYPANPTVTKLIDYGSAGPGALRKKNARGERRQFFQWTFEAVTIHESAGP